jgi:hypothetical protein
MEKYLTVIFDLIDFDDEEAEEDYGLVYEYLAEQGFSDCYGDFALPSNLAVREYKNEDTDAVKKQIQAFCAENEIELENIVVAVMDRIAHETDIKCEDLEEDDVE